MTIVLVSNVYGKSGELLNSGLMGVFDSDERATDAIHKTLRKRRVPGYYCVYCHNDEIRVDEPIAVNKNGNYTKFESKIEYYIEIIGKKVEFNKML